MSEEFIRVYKPAVSSSTTTTGTTSTLKRTKSKSRKSVGQARKEKQKEENEPVTSSNVLLKIFKSFEEKINETKKAIHKDLFESIYSNTLQYFEFYESKRESFDASEAVDGVAPNKTLGLNPICNVIPTVALYTGINVQDYAYLCDKLSSSLRDNFTEYLFFVNEKNAHSIKSLVNSIYSQWENLIEDEEERSKLPKRNMFTFRQFFQSLEAMNKSHQSRPKSIVFFFKQFELIPKETIECFVSLISCYVENVAIYFILELASQSNIIQQQLSSGVISKLCIKKLFLMSPSQYIDKFITQLFIENNMLFKVSGDILKYLVDLYNDYNYSISNLTHALKFCFYDHLHANPLNALMLCEELDDFQLFEQVYELSINQNEANREFFKQLVCPSLGNPSASICLQRIQTQIRQYASEFQLVAQLLYEIVKHFPMTQSNREDSMTPNWAADSSSSILSNVNSFSELFVRVWAWSSSSSSSTGSGESLCESEEYSHLRRLLQLTSSSTMSGMIESMVKLIENKAMENEASYDVEFLNDLFTFHDDILEVMKTKLTMCNQELNRSFNEEDEEREDIAELKAAKVTRSKSLVTRKPSMRGSTLKPISENSEAKKPGKQPPASVLARREDKQKLTKEIDALKSNMITWLGEKFTRYFNYKTFASQPFMRAHFCYSDLDRLRRAVCDVQRLNVHACLMNSFEHVKTNMDMTTNGQMESPSSQKRRRNSPPTQQTKTTALNLDHPGLGTLPLNVAYRLYLECGHMINLHDWLQAFVEKMENAGLEDLNEAKQKRLIALFFRSITELQFMGLIKPTSRKVDHVVKLTNGSSILALEAN